MIDAEYLAPRDMRELFKAIEGRADRVTFVAGCTNVLPNLRARAIDPGLMVNVADMEEMTHIREEDDVVSIGAAATMRALASSRIICRESPILASAASQLGNPLTRNRATIGGNLADASPAADTAPPLLALEATIHTLGPGGEQKDIPLDRFFLGPRQTVLGKGEMITHITFPKPKDPARGCHLKLGLREAMSISVASVALLLNMEGPVCRKARVALGSVAPTPIRARHAEEALEGQEITATVMERSAAALDRDISPISDVRASASYRRAVSSVLLKRALSKALKTGGEEA